eukprot:COSAG02_NODE_3149_length_7284_cov_3.179262_9_plen_179_part_00
MLNVPNCRSSNLLDCGDCVAGIDITSVHPVMDGRSILPLVTAPATTNGKKNSDTASTTEIELRDGNPPKACSPGVHYNIRSVCSLCCTTEIQAACDKCASILQTRAMVMGCAWSHSIPNASAISSTPASAASVAPPATRITRRARRCRGARNSSSSTSMTFVHYDCFHIDLSAKSFSN